MSPRQSLKRRLRLTATQITVVLGVVATLVILYFAYAQGRLFNTSRPKIYFNSIASRQESPNTPPTAAMAGVIENRSDNPAENLVVSIKTLAEQSTPPVVRGQQGVGYAVLEGQPGVTTLQFLTFPAHSKCMVFVPRYKVNLAKIPKGGPSEVPSITSVSHNDGKGRRDQKIEIPRGLADNPSTEQNTGGQ